MRKKQQQVLKQDLKVKQTNSNPTPKRNEKESEMTDLEGRVVLYTMHHKFLMRSKYTDRIWNTPPVQTLHCPISLHILYFPQPQK